MEKFKAHRKGSLSAAGGTIAGTIIPNTRITIPKSGTYKILAYMEGFCAVTTTAPTKKIGYLLIYINGVFSNILSSVENSFEISEYHKDTGMVGSKTEFAIVCLNEGDYIETLGAVDMVGGTVTSSTLSSSLYVEEI